LPDTKQAFGDIEQLDDLALNLVIPSHREKLKDFLRIIDETLESELGKHHPPNLPPGRVAYSVSHGFQVTPSSYRDDSIVCGVAGIDIPKSAVSDKKVPYAEISLVAVKSDAGNWYLALPDLASPELWIRFFPVSQNP